MCGSKPPKMPRRAGSSLSANAQNASEAPAANVSKSAPAAPTGPAVPHALLEEAGVSSTPHGLALADSFAFRQHVNKAPEGDGAADEGAVDVGARHELVDVCVVDAATVLDDHRRRHGRDSEPRPRACSRGFFVCTVYRHFLDQSRFLLTVCAILVHKLEI